MEGQVKQKLCWNCEARVDMTVEACPSCGVYLSSSPMLQETKKEPFTSPLYQAEAVQSSEMIPPSPYQAVAEERPVEQVQESVLETEAETLWQGVILPLGALLFGLVFFLFGLMLLLFSHNGVLTLQWNSETWYYYMGLSVPLLFFGWRILDK